jgi:hypothetical protein
MKKGVLRCFFFIFYLLFPRPEPSRFDAVDTSEGEDQVSIGGFSCAASFLYDTYMAIRHGTIMENASK